MSDSVDRDLERLFALDDGPGPAPPIDAARADALVLGALDAAGFPPPGGSSTPTSGGGGGVAAGKWLAATAILAGAGVAVYLATRAPTPERLAAPRLETPAVVDDLPAEPLVEAPPAIVLPEPTMELGPEDGLAIPRSQKAEDLLAEANKARGKRRWKDADRLYQKVAREYPRTASAQIALVAAGHIQLEHFDRPQKAARLFRAAGKAGGPVAEEARYGLAEAYRATGDARAERAALERFLADYPGSPLADRARTRLTELGKR
jgi:tetratricopeptide (TPR) repeat protein